jgi:RNA polymerase sigma-70 factor (ECF subfamily)
MPNRETAWRERGLHCAVLAGDERAWRLWYDESFAGLHAFVLWRAAGLRDLAEEVVQETWLTAVRRIRSFDPEQGCFADWLRGIAANLLRNHLRRRRTRRSEALSEATALASDDAAQQSEQAEQIAAALADLPPHYEAVLRAKYLDGHSVAAIAEERGETLKAIESLLTRARQAFRDAYQRCEDDRD